RTLVLCFDGTSNHFSNRNTNVVKLVELLKNDDPERQMVCGFPYLLLHLFDQPCVAVVVCSRILSTAGDRICIFGFSRGAYIARAVAGMVHAVRS
ncbi:hypothetical protein BDV93DRAFT_461297, partial [Ceratobasidium sp. AG-I]